MVEPSRGDQVRTGSHLDVNGLVCACFLTAFFSSLPPSMADFVGLTSLAVTMIVTRNISFV